MTAENIVPAEMQPPRLPSLPLREVSVDPGSGIVTVTGRLVSAVSSRSTDSKKASSQDRWTELVIMWRDEQHDYVLLNIGKSLRYHSEGLPCNTGLPVRVSDIADELYGLLAACPACRVADLDDLPDEAVVCVETDRPRITICDTPQELVGLLSGSKSDGREATPAHNDKRGRIPQTSFLAGRLLKIAAQNDPWIRDIISASTKM